MKRGTIDWDASLFRTHCDEQFPAWANLGTLLSSDFPTIPQHSQRARRPEFTSLDACWPSGYTTRLKIVPSGIGTRFALPLPLVRRLLFRLGTPSRVQRFREGRVIMAVEASLVGEKRTQFGSSACRKLRKQGKIPANIYGHKEENIPISVPREAVQAAIASGHRVIDLNVEGKAEKAIFREIQWDAFGIEVQHIDLLRIDPNERVTLDLPLELRGQAPGTLKGGHIEQPVRHVTVEALVTQIPDTIIVRVGSLEIGGAVYGRDLDLPEGVTLLTPADLLLLHVVQAKEGPAPESMGGPAEPELIRKPTEKSEDQ